MKNIDSFDLEWNENKNTLNLKKHSFSFEDAVYVLNSETVIFMDNRADYGEVRYITSEKLEGRITALIHSNRNGRFRIISMRKANEREQKIYYERLKEN